MDKQTDYESNWNFEKPSEKHPGEDVFALVVFIASKEIGVRTLERAEVRRNWGEHVFAWQPIEHPTYTIDDVSAVITAHDKSTNLTVPELTQGEA